MNRSRLDYWFVNTLVVNHLENPGHCLVVTNHGAPPFRVRRDGHRVMLPRYLEYVRTGEWPDAAVALLPGGCKTVNCQNPRHLIPSRRRTMSERAKKQYRKEHR